MTTLPLFEKPDEDQTQDREFRIGLVMAGAISAGAYTAGVMDFMIEAIRAWENAKRTTPQTTPSHKVRFDALAGASAGGMCAGIFASALRNYETGVKSLAPDPASLNSFYRAWVIEVGIDAMLTMGDLEALADGEQPKSVLNVEGALGLEGIRDRALTIPGGQVWPAWLKDPLPIFLCLTNLRGVPYALQFTGGSGTVHGMSVHKDYALFALSARGDGYDDALPLEFAHAGMVSPGWTTLGEACLATGAFPAAFKPRFLSRKASVYDRRKIPVSRQEGNVEWKEARPAWANGFDSTLYDYGFWNVDGGTLDNEPMELARRAIADRTGRNERDPDKATRMTLMIDPFPNKDTFVDPYDTEGDLLTSLGGLINALKQQARFKEEDVLLFGNTAIASRFAIAPARYVVENGEKEQSESPLACGTLGAFGGLLSVGWRHHDYLLGRLNCQKFLMDWFSVDIGHRLIDPDTAQRTADGKARIIPLMNGYDRPEAAVLGLSGDLIIPWPRGLTEDEVADLTGRIHERIKKVLKTQLAAMAHRQNRDKDKSWIARNLTRVGMNWLGPAYASPALVLLKGKIGSTIKEDLKKYDLLIEDETDDEYDDEEDDLYD
jgi:hypothetical protein